MKRFKNLIIYGSLILIGIFLLWLKFTDPNYVVIRQFEVEVPPKFAYEYLLNVEKRANWSPWEKETENLERIYSLNPIGEKANYRWTDAKGEKLGELTILKAKQDKEIDIQVNYFESAHKDLEIEWTFTRVGTKTLLDWEVKTKTSFLGRIGKGEVIQTMGNTLDESLNLLKIELEEAYLAVMPEIKDGYFPYKNFLSVTKTIAKSRLVDRAFVWPNIEKIQSYMQKKGYEQDGAPITIFHSEYKANQTVEIAVPVKGNSIEGNGDIVPTLIVGEVYYVEFQGPHHELDDVRYYLEDYIIKNDLGVCCDPLEEYVVMPSDKVMGSQLITKIYFPK